MMTSSTTLQPSLSESASTAPLRHTLHKSERLCRKKIIGAMFAGTSRSFSLFPLRVVYMQVEGQQSAASIMVSVPKRRFKRAVKRNRVKRQIREAYRLNKQLLLPTLQDSGRQVAITFIYLSDKLVLTSLIEERVKTALQRIVERLQSAPVIPVTPVSEHIAPAVSEAVVDAVASDSSAVSTAPAVSEAAADANASTNPMVSGQVAEDLPNK